MSWDEVRMSCAACADTCICRNVDLCRSSDLSLVHAQQVRAQLYVHLSSTMTCSVL
jgi:hypothetical protein